jgi:hypothetical protein
MGSNHELDRILKSRKVLQRVAPLRGRRTFCLYPNSEGRNLLLGIRQLGPPLSAPPASLEGYGHDGTGLCEGIDRRAEL